MRDARHPTSPSFNQRPEQRKKHAKHIPKLSQQKMSHERVQQSSDATIEVAEQHGRTATTATAAVESSLRRRRKMNQKNKPGHSKIEASEAPERPPGGSRRLQEAPRMLPGGSQEAPRRLPGTLKTGNQDGSRSGTDSLN